MSVSRFFQFVYQSSSIMDGVQNLKDWVKNVEIQSDESLIDIRGGSVGNLEPGWGVFAKFNLREGSRLCAVVITAVLSTITSSIVEIIEVEWLRGSLALALAEAVEKSKAEKSSW